MLTSRAKKAILAAVINGKELPAKIMTEEVANFELKIKEFMALILEAKNPFDVKLVNLENEIAITWSIEDVLDERPDLSRAKAKKVLESAYNKHDAATGVNWEVISFWADELFPKKPRKGEKKAC